MHYLVFNNNQNPTKKPPKTTKQKTPNQLRNQTKAKNPHIWPNFRPTLNISSQRSAEWQYHHTQAGRHVELIKVSVLQSYLITGYISTLQKNSMLSRFPIKSVVLIWFLGMLESRNSLKVSIYSIITATENCQGLLLTG